MPWDSLLACWNKWYHQPEDKAIRSVLAVICALKMDLYPIWLMMIGPPSSLKTEYIYMAKCFENHQITGDLNVPGLISMARERQGQGILSQLGAKGLWLIKDFTSVISMRDEKRNELMAAMREIYDGCWARNLGSGRGEWEGLINVIAGVTPAIEKYHRMAELGERFISIRITPSKGKELAQRADRQSGFEMHKEIQQAASRVLAGISPARLDEPESMQLLDFAEFTARARTQIDWNWRNNEIEWTDETEGPARLYKQFRSFALGDASRMGLAAVSSVQVDLVREIALDTVPGLRGKLLKRLPRYPLKLCQSDLRELCGYPAERPFEQATAELIQLGIIHRESSAGQSWIWIAEEFGKKLVPT